MNTRDPDLKQAPRFYGRRQGHALRPTRRQRMDDVLPGVRVVLPDHDRCLDLNVFFDERKSAFWMEIGFGSGEHLVALATQYPHIGFIGCEPFVNGVAALVSTIQEKSLTNIRIFDDDAHRLFPYLPDAGFQRIYVPYADPWPKKRHHRRRMVRAENVTTFARLLMDGGEFRFASDHTGYVRWVLAALEASPDFCWTAQRPADWRERPADSIQTRYEAKARASGSDCVYLCYERRSRKPA